MAVDEQGVGGLLRRPRGWLGHPLVRGQGGPVVRSLRSRGRTVHRMVGPVHAPSASPNSVVAIERMWRDLDIRPILPTIRVPTLVMHRTEDATEDVEAGRDFAERIPGARFMEFPGGDNAPWLGDPDAVLDAVEEFVTGRRPAPEVDRVLATVLSPDIVGATERAAALGDGRWGELLTLHHERVRKELERFRGREIATAGDGFLATFDGPARPGPRAPAGAGGGGGCRNGGPCRRPHRRDRARRRRRPRDRRPHRGAGRRARRTERGPGLEHREGPRGRVGPGVRGRRRARAEGRPRSLAPVPGGGVRWTCPRPDTRRPSTVSTSPTRCSAIARSTSSSPRGGYPTSTLRGTSPPTPGGSGGWRRVSG